MGNSIFAWLIFIVAVVWLLTANGFNWGRTYNGDVNVGSCPSFVTLNKGDWETYWHDFYCDSYGCTAVERGGEQCTWYYYEI